MFFSRYQGVELLELTFKLPNYFYGAIFASIVLARYGIGRFSTIILGFVLATVSVLIMANANIAFFYWCPVSGLLMVATVWALHGRRWGDHRRRKRLTATVTLLASSVQPVGVCA